VTGRLGDGRQKPQSVENLWAFLVRRQEDKKTRRLGDLETRRQKPQSVEDLWAFLERRQEDGETR